MTIIMKQTIALAMHLNSPLIDRINQAHKENRIVEKSTYIIIK